VVVLLFSARAARKFRPAATMKITALVGLAGAALDSISVAHEHGHWVDSQGRYRIFHGFNVVSKTYPWFPPSDHFNHYDSLDERTIEYLHEWGMNVIRLGVMWPGLEPTTKGEMDTKYLDEIENLVTMMAKKGIYTIVDFHQDVGSRRFCGEGFPEFYVDELFADENSKMCKAAVFPQPMHKAMKVGDSDHYPTMEDCLANNFGTYYMSAQVGALWDQMYSAGTNIQNGFLNYWKTVATRFKDSNEILGFELLNEPPAYCLGGTKMSCLDVPKVMFSNEVEEKLLAPLYKSAADVIRETGAKQTIIYAPTVPPKLNVVMFPDPPLGPDEDQEAFAYHIYCAPGDGDEKFGVDWSCKRTQDLFWRGYKHYTQTHNKGVPGILSEFGAVGGSPGELKHIDRLLGLTDEVFHSWTYWQLKKQKDFTTANPDQSMWDEAGNLREAKVQTLARTYGRAIGGLPDLMKYDPETKDFELRFMATVTVAPTEIYLYEKVNYPDGYDIDIHLAESERTLAGLVPDRRVLSPSGDECLKMDKPEANYIHLTLDPKSGCYNKLVVVKISPKRGGVTQLV